MEQHYPISWQSDSRTCLFSVSPRGMGSTTLDMLYFLSVDICECLRRGLSAWILTLANCLPKRIIAGGGLLSLFKDMVERVLTVISFLPESRIAGESHAIYQCLGETVPTNDNNEKNNVVLLEESPSCNMKERAFHTTSLQWEQLTHSEGSNTYHHGEKVDKMLISGDDTPYHFAGEVSHRK